jgi:hypothetical protein
MFNKTQMKVPLKRIGYFLKQVMLLLSTLHCRCSAYVIRISKNLGKLKFIENSIIKVLKSLIIQ